MLSRRAAVLGTLAVVSSSCFAGVLAKVALDGPDGAPTTAPFTFAWWQLAIGVATLALYTFGWRRERVPTISGREWFWITVLGVTNFTICRVFFMLALELMPATTHTYLVNFVGIVTLLLGIVVLREWPNWIQVVGCVVAVVGLRVYYRDAPVPEERLGIIYLSIAIVALAVTNLAGRRLGRVTRAGLSNSMISTLALMIGGLPVVAYGVVTEGAGEVASMSHWGIIALNGVVAIGVGTAGWNYVLRTLRAYEASILACSSVIFTALFAIPILGERLEPYEWGGVALLLLGLCAVQVRRSEAGDHGKGSPSSEE